MSSPREHRLFSLPDTIRRGIYQRVLVLSTPLYLFQNGGSDKVELFAPERRRHWLALLYVNRQLSGEASVALYSFSRFTFLATNQKQANLVQCFLNCIGPVNTSYLCHLSISFPVLSTVEDQPGKVTLMEEDLHCLELLQQKCVGLRTLETVVQSNNAKSLARVSRGVNGSELAREALSQVDAQLKAIPSLSKTVVKFYDRPPTLEITELMQSLGWVVTKGP